jgi:uncharacterized membrane protein
MDCYESRSQTREATVSTQRLEAFPDGAIAVIITIMVLDMKILQAADFAALISGVPVFPAYAVSFANVGIFWHNRHLMLHVTERINGMVLWANLLLLFWMSLVPFVIRWMDDTHFATSPTAAYGLVLVLCSISYILLEHSIIRCNGPTSRLAGAVDRDLKGMVSLSIYVRVGDSAGLRTSLDCARARRRGCRDLVYTRSAH